MTTHLGFLAVANDRALLGDCLARIEPARAESPSFLDYHCDMVVTMAATVGGDLERGESWADQLVTTMRALGLSEAGVYRTTTTMALHRERGTLGDLGGLADAAEAMGHPAGPSGAIVAYIRHHRGELDAVLAALDAIEGEEFADDAGYPISAAYWAEIVAAIGTDEQRQRFLGPLGVKSGLNLGTGGIFLGPADRSSPCCTTRSATTSSPTTASQRPWSRWSA